MENWLRRMLIRGRRSAVCLGVGAAQGGCPQSLSLASSEGFALRISRQAGSEVVRPCDELAGLYVASAEFDGLARYWRDPAGLAWTVFAVCGPMDPRLRYWFDFHASLRRAGRGRVFLSKSYLKEIAPELQEIRRTARDFAGRRAERKGSKPCVLPEDVLLAMLTVPKSSLAGTLVESGVNVDWLKRVVDGTERPASPD